MKNLLVKVTLLLACCFTPFVARAQLQDVDARYRYELDHYVKMDRVVIKFAPGISGDDINMLLKQHGLTLLYAIPAPKVIYAQLNSPAKSYGQLRILLNEILADNSVVFANPILETVDRTGYGVLGEVVVKLKHTSTQQQLQTLGTTFGFTVKEKLSYIDRLYVLTLDKNTPALELALALKSNRLFEYAEPDYILNPMVCQVDSITRPNDPDYKFQWNIENDSLTTISGGLHGTLLADMRVDSAWLISMGDSTIRIGLIDAGTDTNHLDLVGNLLPGYDATGQGSKGYPNTNKSENAHGTSTAGIMVAKNNNGIGISGVAPNCKVMPIRLFYYIDTMVSGVSLPNTPWSTALWMADAIGYAWHTGNVDIMSNSWGVPDILFQFIGDSNNINAVTDIINQATAQGRGGKGIPMFFSSGNYDPTLPYIPVTPIWPSRLHSSIAVNATSMCDEPKSLVSCDGEQWIGCYGDSLDISAPGVRVVTTDMTGRLGYNTTDYTFTFNGTSAACPNAAGVMALILSVRPDLAVDDAKRVLYTSADTIFSVDTNRYSTVKEFGNWSAHLGYGRVNAYRALQMAQTYSGISSPVVTDNGAVSVYPNPAQQGDINISYSLKEASKVQVEIFGVDGRMISMQDFGLQTAGTNKAAINIGSTLPSGYYLGRLLTNNGSPIPFRFVVMK